MNPENKETSRGGTRARKSYAPLTPRRKALCIACLVLAILAAVLVTVFAAYRLLVVKPSLSGSGTERPNEDQNYEFDESPRLSGDRKEEFYILLLVGRDTGGGDNADTLMVMAYDILDQTLNVMNIPRDTMVNVPWSIKRINSVYNYVPYYNEDGIRFLKEEVSCLIGFQPDYTIAVEQEAVDELVDAVGGVKSDVPIDMNYDDPTQNLHIHLSTGPQDIDGDEAMQLLHWRKDSNAYGNVYGGYPNDDLGRIETQQAFLRTVIEKCLNSIGLGTIPKMAQIFLDNVDTNGDLTVSNLTWFARRAIVGGLSMENIHFMALLNRGASVYSRTYHNYQSYVTPIPDEMLEPVNTCFNPYLGDIELNELDLMWVSEDSGLSSTHDHVEDTKATKPPTKGNSGNSKPTDSPAPEVPDAPKPSVTPTATPEVTPAVAPETTPSVPVDDQPPAVETPAVTPAPEPTPAATSVPTPTPTPIFAFTPVPDVPVDGFGSGMEPVEWKEDEITANEIALTAAEALDSKRGQDIKCLEIGYLTTLADYFVLCTTTPATQIETLANACEKTLKDAGGPPHHVKGHQGGTWILLDSSSVVVHIFNEGAREFHDLERLRSDAAPVSLSGVLTEN